jgi:hypothetical protein
MAAAYHGTESRLMRALEVLALYDGHHGPHQAQPETPTSIPQKPEHLWT